jgi:hypothetical protein
MDDRADNRAMIILSLILALIVVGLISHLRAEGGDFADRDRRGWFPGTNH